MITRFAPSPTGYLHLGHAKAAQEVFEFARRAGGTCLLRLEDIDFTRCRPDYSRAIYEDLDWLGFNWPLPVRVQSRHIADYKAVIENLIGKGLAYPCTQSRAEIKADMELRGLEVYTRDEGAPLPVNYKNAAWRLSMRACRSLLGTTFDELNYVAILDDGTVKEQTVRADQFGDVIIARRDIGVSYHIAVTHDDALQGVTHIIRGDDIKAQTGVHVLLQRLMGWPTPIYRHHPLILREDGQKLAKRNGDPSIRSRREDGWSAQRILDQIR